MSHPHHKKSHSDKKKRSYHKPSGQLSENLTKIRTMFINSTSTERKIEALEQFRKHTNDEHPAHATDIGSMLLEIAMSKDLSKMERDKFFDASQIHLTDVLIKDEAPYKVDSFDAQKYLSQFSIYQSLANNETPSRENLDTSYTQVLQIADNFKNFRDQYAYDSNYFKFHKRTVGSQSELCVLALLRRFESTELDDASWLAIPSLYSQDNSAKSDSIKHSWDVTGLTKLDETNYDLSYKIQVKTNQTDIDRFGYANGISIVCTNNDLLDETYTNQKPTRNVANFILNILTAEQYRELTSYDQRILSTTTDNLLFTLDTSNQSLLV